MPVRLWRSIVVLAVLLLANAAWAEEINPWKAVACTGETSTDKQGLLLTIYFTEAGQAQLLQKQYAAVVTPAEIRFSDESGRIYAISRISGRFAVYSSRGRNLAGGSCIPGDAKPKF